MGLKALGNHRVGLECAQLRKRLAAGIGIGAEELAALINPRLLLQDGIDAPEESPRGRLARLAFMQDEDAPPVDIDLHR